MKDRLEEFVQKHREEIDFRTPDPKLWAAIERELPGKQKRLIPWRNIAVAAGFLMILGLVGTWAYRQGMQQGSIQSLAEVSEELGEIERHYEGEIKEKLGRLTAIHKDEEVSKDLKEMEAFLEELKADLSQTPKHEREVVIQAMIENYRSRVELLERILDRLPSSTQLKKSKNESRSI